MHAKTLPDGPRRLDPRLVDAAIRRAQALRHEAVDAALRRIGRWLRRPFARPFPAVTREQPCRS